MFKKEGKKKKTSSKSTLSVIYNQRETGQQTDQDHVMFSRLPRFHHFEEDAESSFPDNILAQIKALDACSQLDLFKLGYLSPFSLHLLCCFHYRWYIPDLKLFYSAPMHF